MAKVIADTRSKEIEPQAPADAECADSPTAEAARSPAFATAERIRDVAWSLRERGFDPATCEQVEALATAVLSASALRDPADRRAQQLADVLGYLERRIGTMLASAEAVPAPTQPEPVEEPLVSPAVVTPSPPEPPAERPPVARTILAVQSETPLPRSSASLLEGLNAFTDPPTGDAAPAAPPAVAAELMATVAAPPPDVEGPAAEPAPAPMRDIERDLIVPEDTASEPVVPAPLADDAATPESARAALLQQTSFEAARQERAPPSQPPRTELPERLPSTAPQAAPAPVRQVPPAPEAALAPATRPSPAMPDDPLAALMALSDEERIALFT